MHKDNDMLLPYISKVWKTYGLRSKANLIVSENFADFHY